APGLREVSSREADSPRFAGGRARVYTLSFQSPVRGPRAIEATFERTEQAGGAVELPAAFVRGAAGGRLYILARTDGLGTSRIEEVSTSGAERAGRDELPAFAADGGPDFVLSYLARGTPRIAVRRVALEAREQIEASVDLADLLTIVDRSGIERTSARYAIQNRSEQFLELRVPPDAAVWSCFVADAPARPVRKKAADGERVLVPLPKRRKGELSFEVELLLERPGGKPLGWGREVAPAVPEVLNMRVSETFWTVRLPEDVAAFGISGNLEETAEAVREAHRYEKAVDELSLLNDLLSRGTQQERLVASQNIATQLDRANAYWRRAESAQSSSSSRLAEQQTTDAKKLKEQLAANEAELGRVRGRQEALLAEIERNRAQLEADARRDAEEAAREAAAQAAAARAQEAYARALEKQEAARKGDAEKAEKEAKAAEAALSSANATFGPSGAQRLRRGIDLRPQQQAQTSASTGRGPIADDGGIRADGTSVEDATTLGTASTLAPGNAAPGYRTSLARPPGASSTGGARPSGSEDLAKTPSDFGYSGEDAKGALGLGGGGGGGLRGGYSAASGLAAREAGRLSLRLALPETGRPLHFHKLEGGPDLRFRAATFSLGWLLALGRILALVLLLRLVALLGLADPERPGLARAIGVVLVAGLALAAAASAAGTIVAIVLGAAGPRLFARRIASAA
ncbi:MAG TPA: hypothetical protein VHF22_07685, partial [Planctomycetota bacterium]|nr:hypothetical protein [Planctomycetota bacterium]